MEERPGYLKALRTIHLALLAGQCLLLAIMVFLVAQEKMGGMYKELDKPLQVFALLAALAGSFFSMRMFRKRLAGINANTIYAQQKTVQYRVASIVQWVITEFAVMFTIICFFVTGNYSFAVLAGCMVFYFALQAPSKIKLMLQLQLTEQEADNLQ